MKGWPIEVGRVAVAKNGRGAGRKYLVVSELDADFVLISDGALRGLERPKKKRRSHLIGTAERNEALCEALTSGKPVNNSDIRKCLAPKEGEALV